MLTHTCNPSTWEVKAGRLQAQGHPGLHSKNLSQKQQKIQQQQKKKKNHQTTKPVKFVAKSKQL
jgi:hypothetical protein